MINSVRNKNIVETAKLHRKRDRYKSGKTLIEGITLIEEALDMGVELQEIYYIENIKSVKSGKKFLNRIKDISKEVSQEVYDKLTDMDSPQGVIAVMPFEIKDIKNILSGGNYILADKIQDPGNLGTIIRSIDAFKADGLIVNSGTVDPFNPKTIRASMGSIFRVPIYTIDSTDEIEMLKSKGFNIVATSPKDASDLNQFDIKSSIIILGNESEGVSKELLEIADSHIKINMEGNAESLNVAIAASIILYMAQSPGAVE